MRSRLYRTPHYWVGVALLSAGIGAAVWSRTYLVSLALVIIAVVSAGTFLKVEETRLVICNLWRSWRVDFADVSFVCVERRADGARILTVVTRTGMRISVLATVVYSRRGRKDGVQYPDKVLHDLLDSHPDWRGTGGFSVSP